MTVETEISRSGPYAGAGTTGPFLVDYRILDATHLRVVKKLVGGVEVTLAYPADYLVTGVGDPTSSLTTTLAVLSGETLTIIRDVPKTQEADYVQNDDFPAETHENALDKLTMIVQQLAEEQDRALTLPVSAAAGVSTELPLPQSNALIGWNQDADALQNVDPATLATVVAFGTSRADLFSGTGAQTVFTLTANPGAQANLDVAIAGVTQRPGIDYTWSAGTSLTFGTAPPLGTNNILARYQQGLSQGFTDSAASTFLQVGAGATARSVQNRLRDTVSVKDFGAVGDGVTNDTAAIQNAINSISTVTAGAGPGGVVFFPPGRYKITTQITVPYGVSIRGAGGAASMIEAYACDGIVFDMTFVDHNMCVVEDIGVTAMSGVNFTGILAPSKPYPSSQNDGFFINRCRIRSFNIGIMFLNAWQSGISNCDISSVNAGIILNEHGVLVNIDGNTIVRESGGMGTYQSLGVGIIGTDVEAVEVASNFIFGFETCILAPGTWSLVIKSNCLLTIGELQIGIDYTTAKEHLNIFDNIIESSSTATAVVKGIWGRPAASWGGGSVVIRDNRLFDDFGLGTTSVGIQINDAVSSENNNVSIYDNNLFRYCGADIAVYNPRRCTIQNNRCESTAPVNSIIVAAAGPFSGPCFVTENWCQKGLSLEAAYLATGQIVSRDNAISAVFVPHEMWNRPWVPTDASGAGLAITVYNASYSKIGKLYVAYFDVQWPVTASGAAALITLPATPVVGYTGACGYTTSGAQALMWGGTGSNLRFWNAIGNQLLNSDVSGKRISATITFTIA